MNAICSEEDIFKTAREITAPAARAAYLQQACGDDSTLYNRVAALLKIAEADGSFLEVPPAGLRTIAHYTLVTELPDTQIGPYKLREQIGEGGFGVVYVAEQEKPVARKVALKIIKPGMDTREIIARFEAERQVLALMDHPNIAKVLDAGTTGKVESRESRDESQMCPDPRPSALDPAAGRPYFVMELVRGVPITDFCDNHKLPTRERLQLFIDVCRAVQHAHQKGIIHRDLKPSNVMVTLHDDKPVVKVIDFGIAKVLRQKLTEKTVYTAYGQMVGTPLYMSPEQAQLSGLDVDTRSDVYSLGVLLYELLTGSTPFDKESLKKADFDELRRIIREDEPPRPSARISTLRAEMLSTVCDNRHIDPRRLSHSLRGELDWIVMTALEKDRNRRYETASGFAADIQRYLDDEPVQACPPSAWYRFRKFAWRKKWLLVTASCAALVLLLFVTGQVVYNFRITAERDEKQAALDATDAQRRRADANLQHSLDAVGQMLDLSDKHLQHLPLAVHKKYLQEALELCQHIAENEGDDPTTRHLTAQAYILVGSIKEKLGAPGEAESALNRGLALLKKLVRDHPTVPQFRADLASGCQSLASLIMVRGRAEQAEALMQHSVDLRNQLLADPACTPIQKYDLAGALHDLGYVQWNLERHCAAEVSFQEALKQLGGLKAALPEEALLIRGQQAKIRNSLGVLFRTTGRLREAEQTFRQAVQELNHTEEARSQAHLGIVLWMMGRTKEAERYQREALRLRELQLSRDPRGKAGPMEVALNCRWLASLLLSTGESREAEQMLQKSMGILEALTKEFPNEIYIQEHLASTRRYRANLLRDTTRCSEAEANYRAAIAFQEPQTHRQPPDADRLAAFAMTCGDYGLLLAGMGQSRKARQFFEKARQGFRQALQLHAEQYTLHDRYSRFLATCPDGEIRDLSCAVESAKKAVALAPQVGSCWTSLGIAYYRIGDPQESRRALQKATELCNGGDCTDWFFLAMAHWQLGNQDQARAWYHRAAESMERNQRSNDELRRFRAEAEALLGIPNSASQPRQLPDAARKPAT